MTEKRFYYAHGIIFDAHKDNHINKIGTIKDLDIGLRLVNWLNELNDENEQLRHDATVLIQANQDYRRENEQLKQLIKEAEDIILCQTTPHYQRQWENIKKVMMND